LPQEKNLQASATISLALRRSRTSRSGSLTYVFVIGGTVTPAGINFVFARGAIPTVRKAVDRIGMAFSFCSNKKPRG